MKSKPKKYYTSTQIALMSYLVDRTEIKFSELKRRFPEQHPGVLRADLLGLSLETVTVRIGRRRCRVTGDPEL